MITLIVVYTNSEGMKEFRKVPNTLQPSEYNKGILVGPPDLTKLDLPSETTLTLNNALVDAGYVNYVSLAGRRRNLLLLLQSTLGISEEDARQLRNKITGLYQKDYHFVDEV